MPGWTLAPNNSFQGCHNLQAAIRLFGLQSVVLRPLGYFDAAVAQSRAFSARPDGKLPLEEVRSLAAVQPSELARCLKNERGHVGEQGDMNSRTEVVPRVGLEPTRPCGPQSLSLMRIPFRHLGQTGSKTRKNRRGDQQNFRPRGPRPFAWRGLGLPRRECGMKWGRWQESSPSSR